MYKFKSVEVRDPTDFDSAFLAMTRDRAGALVVLPDAIFKMSENASQASRQRPGSRRCTHGRRLWMREA